MAWFSFKLYQAKQRSLNLTILLAEDDPYLNALLTETLLSHVQKVISVHNGEQALSVLSQSNVDLVITDLNMPKMNGDDFLVKVKSMNKNCPPIIVMSGSINVDKALLIKLGALAFYEKPLNLKNLFEFINQNIQETA